MREPVDHPYGVRDPDPTVMLPGDPYRNPGTLPDGTRPPLRMADRTRVQEELRQRVQGDLRLNAIDDILGWLVTGYAPEFAMPEGKKRNPEYRMIGWSPIDSTAAKRLRTVLDVQLRMLNKVLPDLKASEITVEKTERQFTDLELASRVASLVNRAKPAPTAPTRPPQAAAAAPRSDAPTRPAEALVGLYGSHREENPR